MTDHRFEATATITPGEHERCPGGTLIGLVRVILTDAGPIARDDGSSHERPDVICPLRPSEARQLAARLLTLAELADREPAR